MAAKYEYHNKGSWFPVTASNIAEARDRVAQISSPGQRIALREIAVTYEEDFIVRVKREVDVLTTSGRPS